MQWSKLRTQVEAMFADSVQGRVRLQSTGYHKMHDGQGRCWITVDGQEIINMPSWYEWALRDYVGRPDLPEEFADYVSLFARGGFRSAMLDYVNLSIDKILASESVLIRAVGMFDRRLGKCKLAALDVDGAHPLVRLFYCVRCEAEGVFPAIPGEAIKNVNLRRPMWPNARSKEDKMEESRRAAVRLGKAKKTRKRRPLLARIHQGAFATDELDTAVAAEIHAGFERAADRDALLDVLRFVESTSKLLKSAPHTRGVIELSKDAADWIRPMNRWRPKSHNPDRQFSSLARHLWAIYDVPLFMDQAWLQGGAVQQQWFKHIGAGKNIQTAEGLPLPLTKKMAHHFLEAPAQYSIEAAFRWGQVFVLGGERHLADALRDTRLVRTFSDEDFWLSVIRFFVGNPMLDLIHVNPVIDYLWNQRYEPRVAFVERGVARELGPEQPHLSMRGRTAASLLKAVEAWHRRLGREVPGGRLQWQRSAFHDFEVIEGTEQSKNMRVWRIRELLSSQELIAEGRRMHHCVASYANSCHSRKCSIWSMDAETDDGKEPLLTIEISHNSREVRQVRGRRNRLPTEKEKDVLRRWALQEGIKVT